MNVFELNNLYAVNNKNEDFRILVVAGDMDEAKEIAKDYFRESGMCTTDLQVMDAFDEFTKFDCDHVIVAQKGGIR